MKYLLHTLRTMFFLISAGLSLVTAQQANTIVITADELLNGVYGYDLYDVISAIRNKAGITIKSSSDIGAEDWVLVRGLPRDSGRNLLVLIDGMPLNDALSGSNEFAHIPPIEMIEKIVVYKQSLPARFGGATAAIEIITRSSIQQQKTEIAGAYGEYKSGFGSVFSEGKSGLFSYSGIIDYLRTANLSGITRTPPRQTLVYGSRNYWLVRPTAKLIYTPSESSQLALYGQYIDSYKYYSDIIYRGEREFRDRSLFNLNLIYRTKIFENSQFTANIFRSSESYKFNLQQHPSIRDQRRNVQGGRFDLSLQQFRNHQISIGGSVTNSFAEELKGTPLNLKSVTFWGLYAEDRFTTIDRLNITLGVRIDGHSQTAAFLNPNFGLSFLPSEGTTLYALWGRSTRWPSLDEFSSRNIQLGLQAERMQSGEIGIEQTILPSLLTVKVSAFQIRLRNEAKFFMNLASNPPQFYYRSASDDISSRGVETQLSLRLSKNLNGFANYTYNEVKRTSGGAPVDFGGSKHLANLGLTYAVSTFSSTLTVEYGGKAIGVQADGARPSTLNDWLLVNFGVNVRVTPFASVFVRVSNLLNRLYETFDGRPMFGRVLVSGISVNL